VRAGPIAHRSLVGCKYLLTLCLLLFIVVFCNSYYVLYLSISVAVK
jgi:hypothetical protein